MMNRESPNFHMMIKQGITWYNLEIEIETVSVYILFHFRYSMPTSTRVLLSAWLLQMQTASRGGRHRGENNINAGDAYFQERQDDPAD